MKVLSFLGTALSWLPKLSWGAKMLGWLSPMAGALAFLSPLMDAVGAFLKPVFAGIGQLLILYFKSMGRGIGIALPNITAFWALFGTIFLAGMFFMAVPEPGPVQKAVTSIKSTVTKRKAPVQPTETRARRESPSPGEFMRRALGGN